MALPVSGEHREVHLAAGGQQAKIDEEIAPLVKEIWLADIVTSQSCQDNPPGWIWLEFPSSFDLEEFLDIVGDYEGTVGSLHDRMLHGYDRLGGPRVGQWRYEAIVHDVAVYIVEDGAGEHEEYGGSPIFTVLVSLYFPHADLPQVLARLKRFNSRHTSLTEATDGQKLPLGQPVSESSGLSTVPTSAGCDATYPK
jgi:hypothetical protein